MFRYGKLAVAAVVVGAALAAVVGTASASRGIAVSETRIRGASRLVVFRSTSEPAITVRCLELRLAGTSTSTIAKVAGTRAGSITEYSVLGCTSNIGEAVTTLAQNLPWSGYYVAFLGSLPGITGLKGRTTVRFSLFFTGLGISCTYEGSVYGLSPVVNSVVSSGRVLTEETNLSYVAGSVFCPRTATLEGEATTVTPVTVTLI